MKYNQIAFPLAGTLLLGSSFLLRASDIEENPWPETDRVQLGYRMGFNMSVKLHNIGSSIAANNPSVTGKSYTDGFVGTDDTGNAGDLTTYWGYQSAGQVVDGNNYLILHNSSSGQIFSSGDDVNHGLEITWDHEFGRYKHFRIGLETAFNWMDYSVKQAGTAPTDVLGADAFELGYTPPTAPYTGTTTSGPFTSLLGTTPTGLPVMVSSDFDANLYGFRLGPYVDLPLSKRLLFSMSVGLSVTLVDCNFSYRESYATPENTMVASSAGTSDFGAVAGGYVGLQGLVKLTKKLNLSTGIQYQFGESYKITTGTKQAKLDFGNALYWTVGLSYSF